MFDEAHKCKNLAPDDVEGVEDVASAVDEASRPATFLGGPSHNAAGAATKADMAAENGKKGAPKQKGSKVAACIVELQRRLPLARVVYASATGASNAAHMGFMVRLGLFGKFKVGGATVGTGAGGLYGPPAGAGAASSSSSSSSVLARAPAPAAPPLAGKPYAFESLKEFVEAMDAGGTSALGEWTRSR